MDKGCLHCPAANARGLSLPRVMFGPQLDIMNNIVNIIVMMMMITIIEMMR